MIELINTNTVKKGICFKPFLLTISLFTCLSPSFSQVGINTNSPAATLHINSLPDELTAVDGVILPRLSLEQLRSKNDLYTANQAGAIVYVESISSTEANEGKTSKVEEPGFYYFDGEYWNPVSGSKFSVSNGLNIDKNNITLGGPLVQSTTLSNITPTNKFSLQASGSGAININDSLLSVDATNARIGIGTKAPKNTLDIEGTLRLAQNNLNKPSRLQSSSRPLYVDLNTGKINYAPPGFTTAVGGYRPGASIVIKVLPVNNTIVTVRFVSHIDASSEEFNSQAESYAYGDITIVGLGSENPIRFVENNIRDYNGQPKTLISNTPTTISWGIGGKQGITELSLDQSTGSFKIRNYNPDSDINTPILSYFFEFLGGI